MEIGDAEDDYDDDVENLSRQSNMVLMTTLMMAMTMIKMMMSMMMMRMVMRMKMMTMRRKTYQDKTEAENDLEPCNLQLLWLHNNQPFQIIKKNCPKKEFFLKIKNSFCSTTTNLFSMS